MPDRLHKMHSNEWYINGRYLGARATGVQRYCRELASRLPGTLVVRPKLNFGRIAGNIWEQVLLPTKVSEARWLWSPANIGPLFLRRHLVTIHDVAVLAHLEWYSKTFACWYRYAWTKLARSAAAIATVSEFSREELCYRLQLPQSKVMVVPNGVDHLIALNAREPIGRKIQKRFILAVGSIQPRKNLARLIQAWKSKRRKDVLLVLVVESDPVFKIEVLAESETIIYTGHIGDQELKWYYEHAAAYFCPSLYEGFSLPPAEAFTLGCKIYVSDISVHREVLRERAIYFNPKDYREIADALDHALSNSSLTDRRESDNFAASWSWEASSIRARDVMKYVREKNEP